MKNKAANASITFEETAMVMIKATILIQTCKVMLGQIVNITSTKWINKHMNEQINNSYRSSAWIFLLLFGSCHCHHHSNYDNYLYSFTNKIPRA